jgi:hypothetical protein
MRIDTSSPDAKSIVVLLNGEVEAMVYEADSDEGWCLVFDVSSYLKAQKTSSTAVDPKKHMLKAEGKVEIVPKTPELAQKLLKAVTKKLKQLRDGC